MHLLISDSNIFIDMEVSDLTEKMFQLPYCFAVPDILYAMELEEEHPDLTDMGLVIKTLSSEVVEIKLCEMQG